ncbi:MAG TPA: MCE family protein, partial [Leptospiraceae bacterium]|nr:MCE family protein [Leptospiraceae bacterium]
RRSLRKIASNVAEITEKMNSGNGTIAALLNRGDLVNNTNEILRGSLILIQEIREGVEDTRESKAAIDFISVVTAFVGLK